jgi:hypothetical protein
MHVMAPHVKVTTMRLVTLLVLASLILPATALSGAAQEATPAGPPPAVEILVTTTFPVESLPTTTHPAFILWHGTIAPKADVAISAQLVACCPGPQIGHVLAGELTLRVEGPLQVLRSTSAGTPVPVEEVAPGTDVVLRPGDTAVYALDLPTTYHNAGTEPVHLVAGGLFAGTPPTPPAEYTIDAVKSRDLTSPLSAGLLTVTLQRTTLAPEAVFPAPPSGSMQLVMTVPEFGTVAERSDGSAQNLGQVPLVMYALVLHPTASAGSTPAGN